MYGPDDAESLPRGGRLVRRALVRLQHPARIIVIGFGSAITLGTGLLLLPAATAGPGGATLLEAWFTATSAVCVTGLIVVDTPVYWSTFGQL